MRLNRSICEVLILSSSHLPNMERKRGIEKRQASLFNHLGPTAGLQNANEPVDFGGAARSQFTTFPNRGSSQARHAESRAKRNATRKVERPHIFKSRFPGSIL